MTPARTRLAALLAGGLMLSAAAGPALADADFDSCMGAAEGSQQVCGDAWIGREQSRVDTVWQQIIGLTEGKVNDALTAEQRAWGSFRDASCLFRRDEGFGDDGGSYFACRAAVISERAHALETYLNFIDN